MSGEYIICICDTDWCMCLEWVLIEDFDERTEVACEECAKGNHSEDGVRK